MCNFFMYIHQIKFALKKLKKPKGNICLEEELECNCENCMNSAWIPLVTAEGVTLKLFASLRCVGGVGDGCG